MLMRLQKQSSAKVVFVLALTSLWCLPLLSMGCGGKTKAVAATGGRSTALNSKGLLKLTPQQVEARVRAVQADTKIPDNVKPGIIETIRAQGQP